MKKIFYSGISFILCISMVCSCIIVANAEETEKEALTPPPELIIEEGETWVPDAVDPFSMSPYGDEDDCGQYGGPSNYRFIGAVKGSTQADVKAVHAVEKIIQCYIPKPFDWMFKIVCKVAEKLLPGNKLEGDYMKYQYIYNVGPDPNMYWFHYFFEFATVDGEAVGNACYGTYSPKKPGDHFQD